MKDEIKKKVLKPLGLYALAFSLVLPSLSGVVEAAADIKESKADKILASQEKKIEENKNKVQEPKKEVKEENKDESKEKPQLETKEAEKETRPDEREKALVENTDESDNDGLEISDEVKPETVGAAVKAPTVNDVLYDATTISGANLAKAKVKVGKKNVIVIATVHVSLKDSSGTEKANLSVTPTSGTKWKVDLPEGVKVAKGDTVTVYQQIGEDKSPEVTKTAQASKASTVTLKMPSGEIWIEQTSSNIVNEDEQAEAVQLLKDANTDIAGDIKSVKFSIDGTEHAYYEVTYKDNSTTGKVEAPNLKIKEVTETSRGATLGSITIVDNVIKGQLSGEGPFDGIKVQLIIRVNKDKADQYCNENKCTVDKDSAKPVEVTLQSDGTFSYTLKEGESLELDQIVGVSVKEPHKFVSCSTTTVKPVIPEKTKVRDPKKLTADDKKAIDAAIRKAYTVNGVSKLPNGTGDWDGVPAVIQIDDSGNVKIFSGNDVAGDWDWNNGGIFVPEKNEDGSVKLKDGVEPKITISAKDLLKNLKPEKPALKAEGGNVIITPDKVDTDAKTIAVSFKDKHDKDQKIVATKADNGTWSITEGNDLGATVENGIVTLPKNKVKGNTDVTATVTDKGGIADDDTTPLTSDPGTLTVEETIADKVEALGGLDPVALKKWVKDTVDWKDGVKAKDDSKKDEVNKLLEGATFTDETETKRSTSKSGDFEGKVKVKFSDDSEIIVEKQMLYVSDLVSSSNKENLPEDAIDVELKLGEGVKAGEVEGNKETPATAKTYKVKPGTDLSKEKVSKTEKTCFEDVGAELKDDTYVDIVWNDSSNGKNFVVSDTNNVFTAIATKKFKVTVQANGGTGDDKVEYKKSGENFTLPAKDTFTPPNDNQEFSGWQIGDDKTLKKPGDSVTISGDTEIKAIWKPLEFKVNFTTETGATGTMTDVTVKKGDTYELPTPTFTPDKDKEFAGWKVGNGTELKKTGETIDISGDVTLTAVWKDIEYKVTFNGTEGTGTMPEKLVKKGDEYTLPENGFEAPKDKVFDGWMVGTEKKSAGDQITINGDTEVKAVWKDIEYKVTFNGTEGKGSMEEKLVKKGNEYELPENGFTAPKDKEFAGWKVGEDDKKPGDKITVNGDTEVKAIWKDKPVKEEYIVTFDGNTGTGSMTEATVKKGEQYTLPANGFTAPEGKEFAGWKVGNKDGVKQAGDKIDISGDVTLTATWKTKPGTDEPGTKPDPNQPGEEPGTKPEPNPNEPGEDDFYIPEFRIHKDYTPTYPVYVTVPKTEKVKEVPTTLETHKAYIAGYEDNTLRAEGNITRAEAAAMVTRLAGLDLSDNSMPNFKDMQKNAWYFRYINAAVKANMLDADNGMMRPNDKITRAEFAKMLAAIDKENSSVSKFEDIKGHRYEKEINKIYGNNRIEGYEDGSFRPDANLTRAESAAFLNRMFNRIADKEAYAGLEDKLAKFKDFDSSKWYYNEMVEATNSHELTRRGKASDKYERVYEKWTRVLGSDVR